MAAASISMASRSSLLICRLRIFLAGNPTLILAGASDTDRRDAGRALQLADQEGDDIVLRVVFGGVRQLVKDRDRKSTRLNSSHVKSSYAVFCLRKNKK